LGVADALPVRKRVFFLDKLDNILKIVDNENEVVKEMVTEMDAATAKLNQYSRFDQWARIDGSGKRWGRCLHLCI